MWRVLTKKNLHLRLAVLQVRCNVARNLSNYVRLVMFLLLDPLDVSRPDGLARSLRNDALLASPARRRRWLLLQQHGGVLRQLLRICAIEGFVVHVDYYYYYLYFMGSTTRLVKVYYIKIETIVTEL